MSLVTLAPGAGQAIKSLLPERAAQGPVRIEVQFTGCCGPSLGLMVDAVRESDLVERLEDLTFVISPETNLVCRPKCRYIAMRLTRVSREEARVNRIARRFLQ